MPPIATLTANLLAETTYEFDAWRPEATQRAKRESFQVGGKGINVAKMLRKLGAETLALCFPGGPFGPMCQDWLEASGIPHAAFPDGCETRSGCVVRAPGRPETTFLGVDSAVSREALGQALRRVEALGAPAILALCGVVPRWEEPVWDLLRDWIERRPEGIGLAIDTYGPSLDWLARRDPSIVKINRQELETLFPNEREAPTATLLEQAAAAYPRPQWVVTDGGGPVWFKDVGSAPDAFDPPSVACVSPTGSGDVFFAALLDGLANRPGHTLPSAAMRAADFASRSAAMPGIAEFELP